MISDIPIARLKFAWWCCILSAAARHACAGDDQDLPERRRTAVGTVQPAADRGARPAL
jgi:hypothetical protein